MSATYIPPAVAESDAAALAAVAAEAATRATADARTDNPHGVTKTQVGLGSVDNTSDANKPVSSAASTVLALKAPQSALDTEVARATAAENVVGSRTTALETVAALATKRVTLSLTSDGANSPNAGLLDFQQRVLLALPVTTTRWRLRIRNKDCNDGAAYTGAVTFTGAWVGPAVFVAAGGAWLGGYTPSAALAGFATAADGSEYTSPWVTDAALQIQGGRQTALAMGITHGAGTSLTHGGFSGLILYGTGASAGASSGAAMSGPNKTNSYMDIRLEYEFATPISDGRPVVLALGDSITTGYTTDNTTPGVWPHMTWPGAAGVRRGFAWINAGVGGTQTSDWTSGTGWKWDRHDFATTPPDAAVISLGTNNVALSSIPLATFQADIATIIAKLRTLGVRRIYLGTVIPRAFSGAQETLRLSYNAWMRSMPAGIEGVVDFDAYVRDGTTPANMHADYGITADAHPHVAGYQRMADALQIDALRVP